MEFIVGRDQQSQRLCIIRDGKIQLYGQPGSVPMNVSRQHLRLQSLNDGKWRIQNLNVQNVTFVNGLAVETKVVNESDKLELGKSHYLLSWEIIRGPKVETVDIRPLKHIWDSYERSLILCQIADREFQAARSGVGIITMAAMVCGFTIGHGPLYIVVYAIAIILSVLFFLKAKKKASEMPLEQRRIKKEFQKNYVCPKCGHFLQQEFDILIQNECCPHCKAKFIK